MEKTALATPLPFGLADHVSANGHWVNISPDGVYADDAAAVEALAAGYDPLPVAKAAKLADLAALRYEKETGGFLFNGTTPIATDDRSKLMITGARASADADTAYTVKWKVGPGQFVTLDAATIIAISDAVRAHVQACFDREDALATEIEALTDAQVVEAYDIAAGWPE